MMMMLYTCCTANTIDLNTELVVKQSSYHVEYFTVPLHYSTEFDMNCTLRLISLSPLKEMNFLDIYLIEKQEVNNLMLNKNYKPQRPYIHARLTSTSGKVYFVRSNLDLPDQREYCLFFDARSSNMDIKSSVLFQLQASPKPESIRTRTLMIIASVFVLVFSFVALVILTVYILRKRRYDVTLNLEQQQQQKQPYYTSELSAVDSKKFRLWSPSDEKFVDIDLH
jgi:hypothetical protein